MHRNVTAIYRTRQVAETVRRALEDLGIPRRDIHVIPDPDTGREPAIGGHGGDGTSVAAPGGRIAGTGTGVGAPGGTAAGAAAGLGAAPATTGDAAASTVAGMAGAGGTAATRHEHPLHHANFLEAGADEEFLRHSDHLHALHLPEEDLRTYQQAIRHGDYVVSAEVDDAKVEQVKAVMRRPETEAHDIERRASEFRNHDLLAHSAGEGHMLNEDRRARRLAAGDEDRYARTYSRDRRLDF